MRKFRFLLWGLVIGLLAFGVKPAAGNTRSGNRAGLVVVFGNGDVVTRCVSFPEAHITGYQLLERSGLTFEADFDPNLGAFICGIESEGCPKTDCQCKVPDYWSYWHRDETGWVYSTLGASKFVVLPGKIDGWVWGKGHSQPPRVSFEDVCPNEEPVQSATPSATATITETPLVTATTASSPTATATAPPPTHTATAAATQLVTATPSPAATATAAAYPAPQASSTHTVVPQPSATPLPPTQTQPPPAQTTAVSAAVVLVPPTGTPTVAATAARSPTPSLRKTAAPPAAKGGPGSRGLSSLDMLLVVGLVFILAGGGLYAYQTMPHRREQFLRFGIFGLTTAVGLFSFLYPFFSSGALQGAAQGGQGHGGETFFLLLVVLGISFLVLLVEVQGQAVSTKAVAMLGVLAAVNATLRFAEVAFPGPGGFSPIFFLIVLTGYVFGGSMGFLLGVLTMLVSAVVTGGVGPWLPGQMFAAGWVGLSVPLVRPLIRHFEKHRRAAKIEVLVLAAFAAMWGLLFGGIMNLWFWPFFSGPAGQYWQPGIGVRETLARYAAFYLATSFVWDLFRAAGNFLLVFFLGEAVLRVLRRFRKRLIVHYQPVTGDAQPAVETAASTTAETAEETAAGGQEE